MKQYKLVVMTKPKAGREAEYHRWYNEVHLREICEAPGFQGAQRFRVRPTPAPPAGDTTFVDTGLDHLAIYDIETDDFDGVLAALGGRLATMTMTDAIESRVFSQFFEVLPEGRYKK